MTPPRTADVLVVGTGAVGLAAAWSARRAGMDAWIMGIRRDQSTTRQNARKIEIDERRGVVKVQPLADWTNRDVWRYIWRHDIPYNPLHDHGYPSIGCVPCTSSVDSGEDERTGRWKGTGKVECGIHSD